MRFSGLMLARAWLSVGQASSTDKDRPALNRTVSIEQYASGVRLAATDSYMLLHSWVADQDHEWDSEPDPDEAPLRAAVAMDPHGRAKGFMAHVLKLASAEADQGLEIRLRLGQPAPVDVTPTLEGMAGEYVTLELPEAERLNLQTYEGEFPDWRRVVAGFEAVNTDVIALNPEIMGRVAKLGKIHGNAPLLWQFGGADRMARLDIGNTSPGVSGYVMPMRWDFVTDRPMSEARPPDGEEGPE